MHASLLRTERWIIDGFGCVASAWERFSAADTLIYVDLPLFTHYTWVTKRPIKGLFVTPEGWPENSPMWSSTLSSYRVLPLCHRRLTPRYRQLVAEEASRKRVHHLKSPRASEDVSPCRQAGVFVRRKRPRAEIKQRRFQRPLWVATRERDGRAGEPHDRR